MKKARANLLRAFCFNGFSLKNLERERLRRNWFRTLVEVVRFLPHREHRQIACLLYRRCDLLLLRERKFTDSSGSDFSAFADEARESLWIFVIKVIVAGKLRAIFRSNILSHETFLLTCQLPMEFEFFLLNRVSPGLTLFNQEIHGRRRSH